MTHKRNNSVTGFLLLFIASVFLMPYITSCGKSGNASSVGLNTQLEVLNLSPNVQPIDLYLDYIKQNTVSYSYPTFPSYFFLNSIDTPLQMRTALNANNNLFSLDFKFAANHKYSLFVVGTYNIDTISNILTPIITEDDTTSVPPVGFGKIRFVNGAIQSTGLDVTANSSVAFSNIKFAKVSPYVQLPVGNYIFQINPTGSPTTFLSTTLGTTTIQDGRLYTLYSYGIVGHADSSAFGAGVLINR
jgi:hypothetical protein